MTDSGSYTVGFCDQYVTIHSHGPESTHIINYLCCDLQRNSHSSPPPQAVYDLKVTHNKAMLSLQQEGKQLYLGDCYYDLAYALINEIIYQCIVDNKVGQAIHAAAIGTKKGGILMPGKSGSGKSSLVTWLVSRTCNYLSDELVLLAGKTPRIHPFTRPLFLKTGSTSALSSFLNLDQQQVISGTDGFVLPHRLVNENFTPATPPLSLILFPEYIYGAQTQLTPLSAALGCAKLMECYVNARIMHNHGFSNLAKLTRKTPIYQLSYGSFDGLYELLAKSFPTLFT